MDTRGDGILFASDPTGVSASFNVASADKNGIAITLANPSAPPPPTPSWLVVFTGDSSAGLQWDIKSSHNPHIPIADHYNLYWSTSPTVAPGNTTGGSSKLGIPHPGYAPSYLTGLANDTTFYFVVTAVVNGVEGAPSPVYGPVTIGLPLTSGVTVQGNVIMSGFSPTGPLCIGIFRGDLFLVKCLTTPASVQPFQFDNVPDGYYQIFASVDMNNNGVEDPGDISVGGLTGSSSPIQVQGAPVSGVTVTLVNTGGNAAVYTEYVYPSSYTLFFEGKNNSKLITNMTVMNGPNLTQPIDVPWDDGYFDTWNYVLPVRPTIGDTYGMRLRYSDGTIDTPSSAVTDILDGYSTPISPSGTIIGLTPLMTWSQPSSSPSQLPFTYTIKVHDSSGTTVWNPERITSNRTYVVYNEDGTAVPLVSGDQYNWEVLIVDKHGNRGTGPSIDFTPMLPTLYITLDGPGTGDVKSSPPGINCGLSCNAQFSLNQVVMLSATPETGASIFSGWSAACSGGIVTLSTDASCTATFGLCNPASVAMTFLSGPFASISAAYVGAASTDTIRVIASNQAEGDLVFSGKKLTLQGGYDCAFAEPPPSYTTITGSLTIAGGSVTISGIRIQ